MVSKQVVYEVDFISLLVVLADLTPTPTTTVQLPSTSGTYITMQLQFKLQVVYEVDFIILLAVLVVLNPTSTPTDTHTGKCIHFL